MKKLVEVNAENHLDNLIGKTVTLFCCRYIYSGKLISVDDFSVCLKDAGIVYETGELTDKAWKDRQALPDQFYIAKGSIESFGILK